MARFGRDIVRQLTDPTMAQGMFELGRQIGGLPGDLREKKRTDALQKGLLGLEQMAASGQLTPEMYEEALGSYSKMATDEKSAELVRESMARVSRDVKETARYESGVEINSIKEQMYDVQNNPNLPEPEKRKRISELQAKANAAAKEGRLDPMVVGSLSRDVMQDVFTSEQKKLQAERAAKRFDISVDQAEMAVARHEQWKKNVDFQNLANEVSRVANQDLLIKNSIRSGQVSKEEFLAQNPDKEYLFKEIEVENLELENKREEALRKKEAGKFEYTDQELKDIGFNDAEIDALNKVAKSAPASAHNAVVNRVSRVPKPAPTLSASMVDNVAEALLVSVMEENDWDYDDADKVKEGKAIAMKRAMKVKSIMEDDKTFEQAVEEAFMKSSGEEAPTTDSVSDDLQKLLKELQKSASKQSQNLEGTPD